MGADESMQPYREGRLQRRLRRRFASKESRTGLSKELCTRERWIMRVLCAPAVLCALGMVILTEMGYPLWTWTACMAACLFWCVLAGLYETASDWQRAACVTQKSREEKTTALLEGRGFGNE